MSWPHTVLGDKRSPAILFLHGFLGRGTDWLPIARSLAGDFFCILPDLPGHGSHTLPENGELNFESISSGLASLLDSQGLRSAVVVGYSLGGRAALHFTCTRPERCCALVLESASPGIRSEPERQARAALDDQRAARLKSDGLTRFLESWYQADLWQSLRQHPKKHRNLIQRRRSADPAGLARALADLSPGRMPDLWPRLQDLTQPTLFLAGALDEKYSRIAKQAAALIPDCRMQIIPDAGHNIHLEQPATFRDSLLSFLRALPE